MKVSEIIAGMDKVKLTKLLFETQGECSSCHEAPANHYPDDRLCCFCYVKNGGTPSEEHPDCMQAAKDLADEKLAAELNAKLMKSSWTKERGAFNAYDLDDSDPFEEAPMAFHVGTIYEPGPISTKFVCKQCGGDKFIVGQEAYSTAIKCPTCEWENIIHDG